MKASSNLIFLYQIHYVEKRKMNLINSCIVSANLICLTVSCYTKTLSFEIRNAKFQMHQDLISRNDLPDSFKNSPTKNIIHNDIIVVLTRFCEDTCLKLMLVTMAYYLIF